MVNERGTRNAERGTEKGTRWITIGTVRPGFVIIGNCGYPGGLHFIWQGRMDWNQPNEFIQWEHLNWAIERRLEFAGMKMVAMEKAAGPTGRSDLKVLVHRGPKRKRVRL